jgi:3-dehydroquinate synthase
MKFIQIPTTLLSAVDSSVGGKTGVNLASGKNLIGAFYQPSAVFCDTGFLSTLPPDVYRDGCAEVIKHGFIKDREYFESLKTPICEQYEDAIARSVTIKRGVVAEDEFEAGPRKLLNFGHTVGHAIELLSDYKTPHGSAVAAGMAIITRAAFKMGICGEECVTDLLDMLRLYGLPVNAPYGADELARACLSDKKRDGGKITMVFPVETGRCILKDIPVNELAVIIGLGLV